MMKPVLLIVGVGLSQFGFAQPARLVFSAGALVQPYMVFAPGATTTTYLVVDNNATNAITELPAAGAGNIKSEHELNRIRWQTAGGTGSYVIPWTTASNVQMPLTVTKMTAGAGPVGHDSLSLVLATYNYSVAALAPANQWQNNLYMPTDVTHMNDYGLGTPDNSESAIDRFWIIDPVQTGYSFTTKPDLRFVFRYDVAEVTAGNAANGGIGAATTLGAQRFNSPLQKWGDMMPMVDAFAAGSVSITATTIGGANVFRSWTLSDVANPLPVELTHWTGLCDDKKVRLSWTTASESNSDFFTIEKSLDANAWEVIGEVAAMGFSSSETNYSFVDDRTEGLGYYRLSQTDRDDHTEVFQVIAAGCEANSTEIVSAWDDGNNVNVLVSSTEGGVYDVQLTDASGKIMLAKASQVINKNYTQLQFNKNGIARGMYTISLQNTDNVMSRRVVLM